MNIYTHKHHIIPRHAGGTDDISNIIELTVEAHAEAHKVLYEAHGRWQDKAAWQALSGQITGDEARRLAVSKALKGVPKSKEHRAKLKEARKSRPSTTLGMSLPKWTEERMAKFKKTMKAKRDGGYIQKQKPRSEESKAKSRIAALNRPKFRCPHCYNMFQAASLSRYHNNKCKLFSGPSRI